MTYFHVRISVRGQKHDEVKLDMDLNTLEQQILDEYRTGAPMTVNGKTIRVEDLERVQVSTSEEPSEQIIERLRAADRSSRVVRLGGVGYAWRAAARATDVTDQFITGPPGSQVPALERSVGPEQKIATGADSRAIFIVAGRDSMAINAVVDLLRALGLRIVEWEHAVARTGLPNPYVGDVVEAGLRMARAAVVILTPDDLVELRPDLVRDHDGQAERQRQGQARPNVYYEAGIADTLGRDRTIIVEIGQVKSFSDAAGRHVIRYDGSPAMRHTLVQRLKLAGLDVDEAGGDWLSVGDVASAIKAAATALEAGPEQDQAVLVDRTQLLADLDTLDGMYGELRSKSAYGDFSDLPQESLQFVIRAQAAVARYASGTSYAAEADAVRTNEPHERLQVLRAVLESLRADYREPA